MWYTSLALDSNDHPHIGYYDSTNGDLKYARWDGSQWITGTVDSQGDVGEGSSIALDDRGNVYIAYHDAANGDLKMVWGKRIGVAMTGNQSGLVPPAQTITYAHIFTNTGNGQDIFAITCSDDQGWGPACTPGSITLSPRATATVQVTVTVPADAISGMEETTVITATSQADNGVIASAADITSVTPPKQYIYLPLELKKR